MKITLIGFACCYKSSVGKLLAEKLGYKHIDTDKLIEDAVGKSVTDIFSTQGETEFRRMERNALIKAAAFDNVVVSCGGGSVLCPDFDNLAQVSLVVWLTADAATVQSRLSAGRPLFDGKTADELERIINDRAPYYEEYAEITIATDNLTSEQVTQILFDTICLR